MLSCAPAAGALPRSAVSTRATAAPARAPPSAGTTGWSDGKPGHSNHPSPLAAFNAALGAEISRAAETAPERRTKQLNATVGAYMARVARGELPLRPAVSAAKKTQ